MAYFASRILLKESKKIIRQPKALFLNASRLNYDNALDFSELSTLTELTLNNVDSMTSQRKIISLLEQVQPEIIITKEMEIPSEMIQDIPSSVKLLCEAGTGYNNIPIDALKASKKHKHIQVCNM